MATWNETRYERPTPSNRLRDFLVMAVFSLAALAAAFAFVQFKYAGGHADPASSKGSMEAPVPAAPARAPAESAPTSMRLAAASAADAEGRAVAEVHSELGRVRGALATAVARISELEAAVRALQTAPAVEPSARTDAASAMPPSPADGDDLSTKDSAHTEDEKITPSGSEKTRYIVKSGDSAAKVANRHCLPLAELLRFNPDVQDPNTLDVGQALSVEDRCVTSSTDRTATE